MAATIQNNFLVQLQEIFPHTSIEVLQNVIHLVVTSTPHDSKDYQLENMINMLTVNVSGNTHDTPGSSTSSDVKSEESFKISHKEIASEFIFENNWERNLEDFNDEQDLLQEEIAYLAVQNDNETKLGVYFDQLMSIFPDACPSYLRDLCTNTSDDFDTILDKMTISDYPKKEPDPGDIHSQLLEMLPNADPQYLYDKAVEFLGKPEIELKHFIDQAVENPDYPTMEDYKKRQKETNELNRYSCNFNVEDFLKKFPDPEKHFCDNNRKHSLMQNNSENEETKKSDEKYALCVLYNQYPLLRQKDIDRIFKKNANDVVKASTKLDVMKKGMKHPRDFMPLPSTSKNVNLLQEIAYVKNKIAIKRTIKEKNEYYTKAKEEAAREGLLQTCACCFDDELIPEECYFCQNGCIFCRDCVKAGAETAIGDGKLEFKCLTDCKSEFSMSTLKMVLDPMIVCRIEQKKQVEDIKNANLEGLETCPFCDFATIPKPDDKIFYCQNEDCMKETCRECRHAAHIPLRCNEIEYDEDVKMRTYIENKMTEALIRKCNKCSKVFIKESGCNKMTCSCGAFMCYICGQSITGYEHFSNAGTRCPLWTEDLNQFHADQVVKGALNAKVELGVDKNPNKLKFDPTKGLPGV